MIRSALIFICGIAAGVLVYDSALERAKPEQPRILGYTIRQQGVMPMDGKVPLFPLQRPVKEYRK